MEEGWTICPYCQRTGFQMTRGNPGADKTRLESAAPVAAVAAAPAADPRKTVLLSSLKRAPVVGWLVALDGPQKGEDFRLRDGQNLIGSDGAADIRLRGEAISARHASIRYRDGVFSVIDMDSTNGTFLNEGDTPIAREELKDSDVVRIGEVSLKFKCL
jgi:hypothetical protein